MDKNIREYLAKIGKKGGTTTHQKHPDHFKNISKLAVEARKKNRLFRDFGIV